MTEIRRAKSKTLFKEDCEHDINYQGDQLTEELNLEHSYRAVQITLDAYDQRCDVCGRSEQAQFRVTFENRTTGSVLYMGRVCLKKYFGVSESELRQSTFLLTRLARAWEAYLLAVSGKRLDYAQTREAVEHMRKSFRKLDKEHALFGPAAKTIEQILNNLAQINSYRADVDALLGLLGLLHERQQYPHVLNARAKALSDHPHLDWLQQENAHFVLSWSDVTWSRVRQLSEDVKKLKQQALPVQVKQVPVYEFESEESYHAALHQFAINRLPILSEQDMPYQADLFQEVLRSELDKLKRKKSGYLELVFEGQNYRMLDRLTPWRSLGTMMVNIGAAWLRSDISSYEKTVRRREFSNVAAMQREQQQVVEGDAESDEPEIELLTVYYRAFVFYIPDPYFKIYDVWKAYGGMAEARPRFNNLLSEFPVQL